MLALYQQQHLSPPMLAAEYIDLLFAALFMLAY
jgi:hypothetical protein